MREGNWSKQLEVLMKENNWSVQLEVQMEKKLEVSWWEKVTGIGSWKLADERK